MQLGEVSLHLPSLHVIHILILTYTQKKTAKTPLSIVWCVTCSWLWIQNVTQFLFFCFHNAYSRKSLCPVKVITGHVRIRTLYIYIYIFRNSCILYFYWFWPWTNRSSSKLLNISNAMWYTMLCKLEWMQKGEA